MTRATREQASAELAKAAGCPGIAARLDPTLPDAARTLILAGLACFAADGYNATTTRDIATRAGLSPAGMYVHFPSKADLLHRIVVTGHDAILEALNAVVASTPDPCQRLRALIAAFATLLAENYSAGRVTNYEYRYLPDGLRAPVDQQRLQIREIVRTAISDGVSAGVFVAEDPDAAARAVISMCVDISRWYTDEQTVDPATLGDTYGELALRLAGVRPAPEQEA
ncbi:MAG TPA: TetR/AcrR family transcriptional regulator [Mycobacteriales bacterium]|nr:TetR/AcrR family transcriptional regulator [Mycobacteriales bacterium]